ncbi:MAG: SPOR domain-containing protein [Burkholderiales bacterium]
MGLFSRKDGATPRKPAARPRPSVSSEAQAAELRVRARRRLAGAVALVLAAIVVLPMLLDAERQPVPDNIAIRIPDRNSQFQPSLSEPSASESDSGSGGPVQGVAASAAAAAASIAAAPPASSPSMSAPSPAAKAEPKPEPKPDPKAKPDAASKAEARAQANAPSSRTDDGARALALLEGRPTASATPPTGSAPPAVKPQEKGNFVVQAASLDTAADAQGQRDKLTAAGLSNAFVDGPVAVNGKQKYRVRVGPFPSREAAQAAQTRLRTLGFGGAFIASQ